ncbi:hypothetical protein JD969_20625 [Planctomycetota bacterium]|nr:hypothetical protein JD969_20625 [Planctomycetota bacterium]
MKHDHCPECGTAYRFLDCEVEEVRQGKVRLGLEMSCVDYSSEPKSLSGQIMSFGVIVWGIAFGSVMYGPNEASLIFKIAIPVFFLVALLVIGCSARQQKRKIETVWKQVCKKVDQ